MYYHKIYSYIGFYPTSITSHFQLQVKAASTLNVVINKWSNNWELIVTLRLYERLIITASIVTINFYIVAKYNLRSLLELKAKHFVLKCRAYVL